MHTRTGLLILIAVFGAALSAACSSSDNADLGTDVDAGNASSGGLGGNATHDCSNPNAGDLAGCGCTQATRACFTVDPSLRNRNGCSDGKQTCSKQGEFSTWGPCTGEVTSCTSHGGTAGGGGNGGGNGGGGGEDGGGNGNGGGGGEDGGVGGGGGGGEDGGGNGGGGGGHEDGGNGGNGGGGVEDAGPNCTCYPGAVRYCDTPAGCNWGKQTCNPDGTWGACNETNDRPSGCASSDPSYDKQCCVKAGACCQDPYGGLGVGSGGTSLGNCQNIACPKDISDGGLFPF